ncbi:hypothetical protein [Roseovarius indicus]|uniref:hypothetical protein n=1 Tax=Roseovarius indicus TaxID=540747 RepID=UPI0032EAA565
MTDIKTAIERNLNLVAYKLERKFPDQVPIIVIAITQGLRMLNRDLATVMLDYRDAVRFNGVVMNEAYRVLRSLGYRIKYFRGEPMTHILSGRAELVSHHERLRALIL